MLQCHPNGKERRANNDPEVGELIATAMQKVGREGVVHIEESKSGETYLETVEGMQFERGCRIWLRSQEKIS